MTPFAIGKAPAASAAELFDAPGESPNCPYQAILCQLSQLIDRRLPDAARTEAAQTILQCVESLAFRDELTGLLNRAGFLRASRQLMSSARALSHTVALFFIDVDGLKLANDVHGHGAGDLLLRATGSVLREAFRETDIVARIGGDEFVALIVTDPSCPVEGFAARLRKALYDGNAGARAGSLSLSIGIAQCPAIEEPTLEDLMARADKAMYAVKRRRGAREGQAARSSNAPRVFAPRAAATL